jgi:hypothetical protein
VRIGGRILALVAVAFLGWASVADNPAVCPDEQAEAGTTSHRHDTPPASHCCWTAPCHTPTALQAPATPAAPADALAAKIGLAPRELVRIDGPVPPTPPPTLRG